MASGFESDERLRKRPVSFEVMDRPRSARRVRRTAARYVNVPPRVSTYTA
jgi:hypothetical protein